VLLFPFTRLIHAVTIPLRFLSWEPQVVLWNSLRRMEHVVAARVVESRRRFVRGVAATAAGATLLGAGVLDKLLRFFQGPSLAEGERADLMEQKLTRIKATVEQRELELERLRKQMIEIGRLGDLDARKGRYFIDFEMRTALAFRGDDGMPLLISAKCTHLGCTVASEVDDNGKILCPCHISYFDVRTGMPNPGAPAKTPLPHLEWVLVDPAGAVVARRTPNGVEQLVAGAALDDCAVYLTRRGQEAV
jgi:Rieske Fe-S protein